MTAIYRYEIPVDSHWHTIDLAGEIIHVATRSVNKVEVWTMGVPEIKAPRTFRVYGTGQELPDNARYIGTALAPPMVWHLLESIT